MNAVRRASYEVEMAPAETTDVKIDALSKSLDETKQDVRELRQAAHSHDSEMSTEFTAVRREMSAGFTAIRRELSDGLAAVRSEMNTGFAGIRSDLHTAVTTLTASNAEIRASVKTLTWVVGILATLVFGSFAAEKGPRLLEAIAETDASVPVAAVR
jgi:chromosome segregation ATPase